MRNLIIAGCFLAIVYPLQVFAESGIQYCNPTSTAIPDDGSFLTDTIVVPPGEKVEDVTVSVDITHPRVNDLSIALLHDTQGMIIFQYRGCAGADINATFSDDSPAITCNEPPPIISGAVAPFAALSGFDGLDSQGEWTIEVIDDTPGEVGNFNQWCITITKVNIPPTASFTASCADQTCDFTDTSTDPDGTIVEWYWSFEDGTGSSSTEQNPSYTFPVRGTFGVSLRAHDDRGEFDVDYQSIENYPNTHPVADTLEQLEVLEDTLLPVTLTGSDGDGDPLSFWVSTPPQWGNVDEGDFVSDPVTTQMQNRNINVESLLVNYQPFPNYHGPDSFEYVANDGYDDSEPANVSITVKPVNDPPVFAHGPDPQWPVAESGAKSHAGWITYITTGPEDSENDQSIVDFIVGIEMDPNGVLSAVDVQNDGTLEYTLTGNSGGAVISVSATDDGGTEDGGIDTSEPQLVTITVLYDASTLPTASYAGYMQLPPIYPIPEVCCFDYTGDGVPDNAFGALASTMAGLGINANEIMAEAIEAGDVSKLLFWNDLPAVGVAGSFELEFGNGSWSGSDDYPTRVAGEGEFIYDSNGLEGHPPNIQSCVVDETANFQCTGDTLSLPLTIGGVGGVPSDADLLNIMIEGQYVAGAPGCAGLCSVNETAVQEPVVHGGFKIGGLMHLDAYFGTLEESFQSCVCFGDGSVQLFEYGEGASEYTFGCTAEGEEAASTCQDCIDRSMNLFCSLGGPLIINAADIDTNDNGVVDSFSVGVRMGVSGANIVGCSGNHCIYTVGGNVSGLSGSGLVLQNNSGDDLSISANGSFTFDTPMDNGATYSVTVLTQPTSPAQTCSVTNGSGTLSSASITNVEVTCVTTCNVNMVSGVTEYFDTSYEACEFLILGPDFIAAEGALSVSSGWQINFLPGFLVQQGATLNANVCGQSLCMAGDLPMPYGCHSCVNKICDKDRFCCTTKFDQTCQDMVSEECELVCK